MLERVTEILGNAETQNRKYLLLTLELYAEKAKIKLE